MGYRVISLLLPIPTTSPQINITLAIILAKMKTDVDFKAEVVATLDTLVEKTKSQVKKFKKQVFHRMNYTVSGDDFSTCDTLQQNFRSLESEFETTDNARRNSMCPKLLKDATENFRLDPETTASVDGEFAYDGPWMNALDVIPEHEEPAERFMNPTVSEQRQGTTQRRTIRRSLGHASLKIDDSNMPNRRRMSAMWNPTTHGMLPEHQDEKKRRTSDLWFYSSKGIVPQQHQHQASDHEDHFFHEGLTTSTTAPVLELLETDPIDGRKYKLYQPYRGTLSLRVYPNCGLLTVHIKEAQHLLPSPSSSVCNTFVNVSLVPDESRKAGCCSTVMYGSTSPVFDEKMSFEIGEEDQNMRLLVSVWNQTSKGDELLGSTSYGISSVMHNKGIEGRFYLLSETIGARKHLLASPHDRNTLDKQRSTPAAPTNYSHRIETLRLGKISSMTSGFSVQGSAPSRVNKVRPGSTADTAGMCVGDEIIRVGKQKVAQCSAAIVRRVIRKQEGSITLEVRRRSSSNQ